MVEVTVGLVRLRWDAARRLLFVRGVPGDPGPAMDLDDVLRRIGGLLAGATSYAVVLDAHWLGETGYQAKAFWFSFFTSFPHPRRIAVHAAQTARDFDIFGSLTRIPLRSFPTEEDAVAWATEP
jgi:hypothetical protein